MTDTTLPPEVAEALPENAQTELQVLADYIEPGDASVAFHMVARRLHRLAEENARLLAANRDCVDHFEQMRGELAALKARIAEARRVMLGTYPAHGSGYVQIVSDPANGIGDETFALLKLEDGER